MLHCYFVARIMWYAAAAPAGIQDTLHMQTGHSQSGGGGGGAFQSFPLNYLGRYQTESFTPAE